MTIFWLSFADPKRPRGEQWLGAAIVRARNSWEAIAEAHLLGCNPGGEVLFVALPPQQAARVPERWIGKLLTKEDVACVDEEMGAVAEG